MMAFKKCKVYLGIVLSSAFILSGCTGNDQAYEIYEFGEGTKGAYVGATPDASAAEGADEQTGNENTGEDGASSAEGEGAAGTQGEVNATEDVFYSNLYTFNKIKDTASGIEVLSAPVPYGWTGTCDSGVMTDTVYPFQASIRFYSPDNKAMIGIQTARSFCMSGQAAEGEPVGEPIAAAKEEGVDESVCMTFLNYKNAEQYLGYFAGSYLGSDVTAIGAALDQDEESAQKRASYMDSYSEGSVNNTRDKLSAAGIDAGFEEVWHEATSSEVRFTYDNGKFAQAGTTVLGQCFNFRSHTGEEGAEAVNGMTQMVVPFVVIYTADDEETFVKYFNNFRVLIDNMSLSPEFDSFVKQQSEGLTAQFINTQIEQLGVTEVQSADTNTATDTFEMWKDALTEYNVFTSEDGVSIRVPTEYDTVFRDGDSFYAGPKGPVPNHWVQLDKGSQE